MIDYNIEKCQETTNEKKFGICDDIDNNDPAYLNFSDLENWNAEIINSEQVEILFTAIDNCINIIRDDGNMEKRCDCMLSYPNNIVFIELKKVRTKGWIPNGIEQLRTCIQVFKENNDINLFRKRRAVLANSKKPYFHFKQQETMQRFFNETKVRLIIGYSIKI